MIYLKIAKLLLVLLLFIHTLVVPAQVSADGMMIYRPDPYSNRWDFIGEQDQQAFINYSDGIEKLIVAIQSDTSKLSSDSLWLLPVPADANKVVVDVVSELPKFSGEEADKLAKSKLDDIKSALLVTQIYPIPYIIVSSFLGISTTHFGIGGAIPSLGTRGLPYSGGGRERDVQVVEHLEKEGMITEVITARTVRGLYDYFKSKKLNIVRGSIPVLDEYIGKDYSFVASWSDQRLTPIHSGSKTGQKAIFVTFPTKQIYFPLLPTSVYGSKVVPATIRITGHVSPDIYKDIKPYTNVKYYVSNDTQQSKALIRFWSNDVMGGNYTKIEIAAPSKLLSSDLWVSRRAPIRAILFTTIGQHPAFSTFILLVLISIVSSVAWAFVLFPAARSLHGVKKYTLLGLTNCLTLLTFFISALYLNTKNERIDAQLFAQLRQKGYVTKRRIALIILLLWPFLWVVGPYIQTLLLLPFSLLGLGSFYGSPMDDASGPALYILGLTLVLSMYILPYVVVVILLILVITKLGKIHPKDQALFDQLKKMHISSWTFVPKDVRKLAFIPLFTITFVLLSLSVLKLVETSNAQEVNFNEDIFLSPTPTFAPWPTSTPVPIVGYCGGTCDPQNNFCPYPCGSCSYNQSNQTYTCQRPTPTPVPKVDLVIDTVTGDDNYYYVRYCNEGTSTVSQKFQVALTNRGTGQTFPPLPFNNYPFDVPAPGTCARTGGFTCGLIGSNCSDTVTVEARIDPDNSVAEIYETDNAFVKLFPEENLTIHPTSFLLNGSFENASDGVHPDNWTKDDRAVRSPAKVTSGNYGLLVHARDNSTFDISQTVNSPPVGVRYSVSMRIHIPTTDDTFVFEPAMQWLDKNKSVIKAESIGVWTSHTYNTWSKHGVGGSPVPDGAESVKVILFVSDLNAKIYVDDIVLSPI